MGQDPKQTVISLVSVLEIMTVLDSEGSAPSQQGRFWRSSSLRQHRRAQEADGCRLLGARR
jgi:hypothetical protein